MGSLFGGGGGDSTTTVVQQIPPEVLAQYRTLIAEANNYASLPYQQYTGDLIAGTTGYQNQAYRNIADTQGRGQQYYNAAANYLNQGASPVSSSAINNYMSPYLQQVVNSTRANMQENNAQAANNLTGNAISAGAFGGDRAGVAQAELARQQNLADNQTIAGLYNTGYSQALGAAQQDQQNALTAAGQLQNLGTSASSTALNEADAMLNAGNQQQQQAQNQLNAQYELWQNQQQYPYEMLAWLSQLSTGLGGNMGGSSTSTSSTDSGGCFNSGGRVGLAFGGNAMSSSLGRMPAPSAAKLPEAKAPPPPEDQTMDTLMNMAKLALMFLNTGGRVARASGGSFTPTLSSTITGAQKVPGSTGTILPQIRPAESKGQNMQFTRGNLPTASAPPIPRDNTSDTLTDMASLYDSMRKIRSEFDDGKTDKAEYVPSGDVGRASGAANATPFPPTGVNPEKISASMATAVTDPNALPEEADFFGEVWKNLNLFARGGAITPNAGGMGYRRGGTA